jgi:hypothetical protein
MATKREFSIYLSSTFDDLGAERKAAIDVMRHYGRVVDSCRAGEKRVVATCIEDVRGCDLYVGIVGGRYGWVPPAQDNPKGLSITEIEYEAAQSAGQPKIDRLMFLKTGGFDDLGQIDADRSRVDAFKKRAAEEQTALPFKDLGEFRLQLDRAVRAASAAFHAATAPPGGALFGAAKRQDLLAPVALAKLAGTDDAAFAGAADARLHVFEVSPAEAQFVAALDAGCRRGQAGALWVSAEGLARLRSDAQAVDRVAAAIAVEHDAGRALTLLLHGVAEGDLPAAWDAAPKLAIALAHAEPVWQALRAAQPGIGLQPPRVALPYVIVAPTRAEVDELVADGRPGFAGFDDDDERADRIADFDRVAQIAHAMNATWPAGVYAARREQWRAFGDKPAAGKPAPDADELVRATVERINDAPDGARERRLLRTLRIVPRAYRFDELLADRHGSAAAVRAAVRGGALVVIDEFALLHPRLREAARELLGPGRTAVVSISGCDPAHSPTRKLLGSRSFLHVGALVSRFADEQDPRCELAINSVERLQRWLRLAVPELVARAGDEDARAELVRDADALFAP